MKTQIFRLQAITRLDVYLTFNFGIIIRFVITATLHYVLATVAKTNFSEEKSCMNRKMQIRQLLKT